MFRERDWQILIKLSSGWEVGRWGFKNLFQKQLITIYIYIPLPPPASPDKIQIEVIMHHSHPAIRIILLIFIFDETHFYGGFPSPSHYSFVLLYGNDLSIVRSALRP
jgi:hypothetical protein